MDALHTFIILTNAIPCLDYCQFRCPYRFSVYRRIGHTEYAKNPEHFIGKLPTVTKAIALRVLPASSEQPAGQPVFADILPPWGILDSACCVLQNILKGA